MGDAASVLVALAQEAALFHTPEGEPYATVTVEAHRVHYSLRGDDFRRWLSRRFFRAEGQPPGSPALHDAVRVLEGQALHEGAEAPVFVRKAEHDGAIYLDLADAARQVIAITASGWRFCPDPPVRFRRAAGMLPLPMPARGGQLDELRPFLNAGSDADFRLAVSWLLAALGPHRPYPILALQGEAGAAKSTGARVLRRLVDPHLAELRGDARGPRDLAIAARNSLVFALDNVSALPAWLADALSSLSTGAGMTARRQYSKDEEVIVPAMRPVLMAASHATYPSDLLDRALVMRLPAIPEERLKTEEEFWGGFEAARPRLLGAALDAVAMGLQRLPVTRPERLLRMADFTRWGSALEGALGWEEGGFLAAYRENRRAASRLALPGSPIVEPVCRLVESVGEWTGACKELLPLLAMAGDGASLDGARLPATPEALSHALRASAARLRREGVEVTFLPRQASGRPIRLSSCPGSRDGRPAGNDGHDGSDDSFPARSAAIRA